MEKMTNELTCKVTTEAAWIMCPVCRRGKLLKLLEDTRAHGLILFCRNCKQETVVDIEPENRPNSLPRARMAAKPPGTIPPPSQRL